MRTSSKLTYHSLLSGLKTLTMCHDFPYHPSPADPSVTRYVDGMLQNGVRNKFGDHESWDERGNKNTFSIQR